MSKALALALASVLMACQAPQAGQSQQQQQQAHYCAEKGLIGNVFAPYAPCPAPRGQPQPSPPNSMMCFGVGASVVRCEPAN